jgi:hypothetical protein
MEAHKISDKLRDALIPLVNYLNTNCKGKANAATNGKIRYDLGNEGCPIRAQDLREMMFYIRNEGLVVGLCATPHDGYFVAKDAAELNDTIASLNSRLINQRKTYLALKRQQRLLLFTGARQAQNT